MRKQVLGASLRGPVSLLEKKHQWMEIDLRPQGSAAVVAQGAGVSHQPLDGSMPQLGSLGRYRRAGTNPEGTGSTFI